MNCVSVKQLRHNVMHHGHVPEYAKTNHYTDDLPIMSEKLTALVAFPEIGKSALVDVDTPRVLVDLPLSTSERQLRNAEAFAEIVLSTLSINY